MKLHMHGFKCAILAHLIANSSPLHVYDYPACCRNTF